MLVEQPIFKDSTHFDRRVAAQLLANTKRIERKTFPTIEVFDFDTELKKRNTHIVYAVGDNPDQKGDACSVAYLVYARTGRTALLHKICVAQRHRGKGVGRQMMTWFLSELNKRGCEHVQLWVDESRESVRALYVSLGFRQVDYVADYYSPGRAGLKMILYLQSG